MAHSELRRAVDVGHGRGRLDRAADQAHITSTAADMTMPLPAPRGPLTDVLLEALSGPPQRMAVASRASFDPLGDDAQLALCLLQELGYRRVRGVDEGWEQEPSALALRVGLEERLEDRLRAAVTVPSVSPEETPAALRQLVDAASGPSLSGWVLDHGTIDHMREFVVHRAAYQLKEGDPHTRLLPRLAPGPAKTALLEIQADEYGGPDPREAHSALFAATMAELGVDAEPQAGLDLLPAPTLVTNTLLGLLCGSRRLVGAGLGHLAVFEMTSVEPMARYAAAARRVLPGTAGTRAARFYDVHVAADGRHERIALDEMVAGFVDQYPGKAGDVLFGAAALMWAEGTMARHLLDSWAAGTTSLRQPLSGSDLGPLDDAEQGRPAA